MQCLILKENFIFTCPIKHHFESINSEAVEITDSILLVTINAIYIFAPTLKRSEQNNEEDYLEKKLLFKFLHEDAYIDKFTNDINEVKYIVSIKYEDENKDKNKKKNKNKYESRSEKKYMVSLVMKLETPLAKEYIKILALFEAWKLAIKVTKPSNETIKEIGNNPDEEDKIIMKSTLKDNYKKSPDIICLFQIIDSFIQHDYVFQIDFLIIQLYKDHPVFLKQFFYVITIFDKIKIELIFDEKKTDISDIVSDIFPTVVQQEIDFNNVNSYNIKYSLINLSLKSSRLRDSFAEKILPYFILRSPFLQILDLSHNYLTNGIFQILLQKDFYINVSLKSLNLSYNGLSSENLSKYIFQLSKEFLCITLFDLRGNKIDNRFLNNFNPKAYEELRNIIQDKLSGNNPNTNYSKEIVVFDLRDTNINIEKTSFRLYLKKKKDLSGHLEIKNNFNDNYENKYFGLENINFIFDVYFFKRSNYKYSACSKNKSKLNVDVKYFQLRTSKNIVDKKITQNEHTNNWFKTNYYEKENDEEDDIEENAGKSEDKNNIHLDKKKRNAISQINDPNTKNNKSSIIEEESSKTSINPSDSKITSSSFQTESNNKRSKFSSTYGKDSKASRSRFTREIDSRLYDNSRTIIEENSESFSEKSDKINKKSSEESGEGLYSNKSLPNNKKPKESNSESQINNNIYSSKVTNTNNNNESNDEKNDNNNENNNPNNANFENNEEQKDDGFNNRNTNNNNDTIIIDNTDDDSSEEEKKVSIAKRKESFSPSKQKALKENINSKPPTRSLKKKNTLFDKNLDYNKINQFKKQHELDLYRELFRYFFLLDYFFDPILNSFATEMPAGIKRDKVYMSIKNEDKRYEALRNSINFINSQKRNKKHKIQENENINIEIYQNEAKQMYYDYQNMLHIKKSEKNIRKLTTQNILTFLFKNKIKNSIDIFNENKKFNPNGLIDHLSLFYLFLASPHDYDIKIPFTTLNKLISRIKLESLLCLKEKSHNALKTLSYITAGLNLSVKAQVNNAYNQLTEKARLILKGLYKVLNFEGYNRVNNMKGFLFETGNFLDIFLEKAESIYLDNDLVIICKYIQYWRDNYLRNIIYNLMHEIGKREVTSKVCDMTEEFAKANEDYKNIPIKNMGLTKDIRYPELAQHPSNVDYLYLSEQKDIDFEKDLKNITRYIKADQTYFKRNLYDRINFLFCSTSRNRKNKTNCYSLHKGNMYLKVMRILFRFNNNLDYKELEKKMKNLNQEYIESPMNTSNMNASSIENGKIFNKMIFDKDNFNNNNNVNYDNFDLDITDSLDKIAIEENYLRVIDFPEEDNMEISEITRRDKKKIRLLLHSNNYNEPDTLLDLSLDKKLTSEQMNLFIETTRCFKSKCQEKLLNWEEMTHPAFISIIQDYIRYFLIIKQKFKNEGKLWEYQNLECFYQLYRFANVDNFSYRKGKNEIDYPFIFLYIMCFYFEFNVPMIKRVKGFAYYLFSHLNHRKHCKGIIRALNNPFRYKWVMSTYELYSKIDCKPLTLSIYYPSNDGSFKEDFIINETSTASDLMKDIYENSIILKDSKEKYFYWVYFTTNEQPWRYQYINYEQLLVELISVQEENEIGEKDLITVVRNESIANEEKRSSYISNNKLNEINNEEDEKTDKVLTETKTFKTMHFEVKRRIFTPNLLNGNIMCYNYYEKELLFNQIKNIFYSSEIVDYTWSGIGEKIATACYLEGLAEKKRQAILKRENDLENRISSSRIVTKFNMNMKEIELMPLFDKSKEDSFVADRNLTYNNKDRISFGINSTNSSKNNMTYKTYNYNIPNRDNYNTYNSNMDPIKEEDDDENNFINNNISENNKNDNNSFIDNIDKEIYFPKNLDLKNVQVRQIYNEIESKAQILSDPKDIFFDLVKERPILMANIFEVNIKQSNESFPERFLLSINLDKVEFLYRTNYKKFFEFKYEEIVKCLILDNYVLLLVLNVFKDEIDQRSEIMIKIESMDNRFIMEDILSYSQLFLAINTKSQYVQMDENTVSFLKGYKLMFDRPLPFRSPPHHSMEEINRKEIEKMRELLHNNEIYKKYKEDKAKKEEDEKIASKKGKLDIKSLTNIPRYNQFEEENSDSEESSESVKVVGLKLNASANVPKTEIASLNLKKDNNVSSLNQKGDGKSSSSIVELKKEESKVEEKEPEKTEEEKEKEMEYQKKLKENEDKRKKADLALSKALQNFDFDDDDDDNEEKEEF